ncbi:MAG: hypothetical protein WBV71_17105 [Roseobacter sp.]
MRASAHCRHSRRKAPMAAMRKTGRSLRWWLMSQLRDLDETALAVLALVAGDPL